jgi:hypothetical protein
LLPLNKPWFSVNVGLLAQTPTHPIGHEETLTALKDCTIERLLSVVTRTFARQDQGRAGEPDWGFLAE